MRKGFFALAGAALFLLATACNDSTDPGRLRPSAGKPSHLGIDGSFTGAIWTAVWDNGTCSLVDANKYASKDAVGLNGGPRSKGSGSLPDGDYYVRVTGVSGQNVETELGASTSAVVHVTNGQFDQCYHLVDIVKTASSGFTVNGFDDTPNNGGEYKVWLNPDPTTPGNPIDDPTTFDWQNSKTDNFKIRENSTCDVGCTPEPQGVGVVTLVRKADGSAIGATLPLGASVHDSAVVTLTGGTGVAPDGSVVSFYFWNNDKCTGTADLGPDDHALASGATTPISVGDGLPQTGLAPGKYGYKAVFTSGDANLATDAVGDCEPFEVVKGSPTTSTNVHNAAHTNITSGSVTVGAFVHDTATLDNTVGGFTPSGTVTFSFYNNKNCSDDPAGTETVAVGGRSTPQQITAVGDYAYSAKYNGDDNYEASANSDCEPFGVTKAPTTISTQVHDPSHKNVTGGSVIIGTFIHDTAAVGGAVTGVTMGGTVTYSFFATSDCLGTATGTETVAIGLASSPQQTTDLGAFAYSAKYDGDNNYEASSGSDCEPITVRPPPGKTMGFWGNINGIARIGDYSSNSVTIGRGAVIDTKEESQKVLPNTLNACGKGSPQIFFVGPPVGNKDCTTATGVNSNTLNTAAAQTLALGYNIKLIWGALDPTVAQFGCATFNTPGVQLTTKVSGVFTVAVGLINGSPSGGSTTQAQLGALNQLLGCLNKES
jgi:hypothetical protein